MYHIIQIEPYNSRFRVCLDNHISFVLYKGEINKLNLSKDMPVDDELFHSIMKILFHRAKEKALYLLDSSYRTEREIRDKLKKGLYPDEIIVEVVSFLKEYNFINDYRYACLFIEYKSAKKSKKQIVMDLIKKGISKDIIDKAFEVADYDDSKSLKAIISKNVSRYNLRDSKDLARFYRYLLGKGYSFEDVKVSLTEYIQ